MLLANIELCSNLVLFCVFPQSAIFFFLFLRQPFFPFNTQRLIIFHVFCLATQSYFWNWMEDYIAKIASPYKKKKVFVDIFSFFFYMCVCLCMWCIESLLIVLRDKSVSFPKKECDIIHIYKHINTWIHILYIFVYVYVYKNVRLTACKPGQCYMLFSMNVLGGMTEDRRQKTEDTKKARRRTIVVRKLFEYNAMKCLKSGNVFDVLMNDALFE